LFGLGNRPSTIFGRGAIDASACTRPVKGRPAECPLLHTVLKCQLLDGQRKAGICQGQSFCQLHLVPPAIEVTIGAIPVPKKELFGGRQQFMLK
jgi:hypothetical protein